MAPIPSISSRFESSATSSTQWRSLLQEVKLLYIQHQYKQCASRSLDILHIIHGPAHPIYKTYLYFYSAISYEAMGRTAHNYSAKKLSLLHSALDYFVTCNAVLPFPGGSLADDGDSSPTSLVDSMFCSSERPSSTCSLASSVTDISDIDNGSDDPFVSDTDTGGDLSFNAKLKSASDPTVPMSWLMPAPLRVQKSGDNLQPLKLAFGDPSEPRINTRAPRPPPLPIKIVPLSVSNSELQREAKVNLANQTKIAPSPSQMATINTPQVDLCPMMQITDPSTTRYHDTLHSLRAQIHSSISAMHCLIDEVTELQHARRATRNFRRSASFWSFSPVKNDKAQSPAPPRSPVQETMEQRIVRLRADGWKTVGLRAPKRGWKGTQYYQAYCTDVLNELCQG
ncbi:hypothetical protein FE257_005312 [Aspergillus nanangensis]|uniref:Uncharacterized protein n=1 Tax=Aspergillus nanangensis TaxID=2582783 RepID=A0AAD4GM64_ASPNN|nr:hypothetical protein FE257_005312 [Aspergillus nanangensis]